MSEQPGLKLPAFDPAELRESNLTGYPAKYRAEPATTAGSASMRD
jgi:hypothetical protein